MATTNHSTKLLKEQNAEEVSVSSKVSMMEKKVYWVLKE